MKNNIISWELMQNNKPKVIYEWRSRRVYVRGWPKIWKWRCTDWLLREEEKKKFSMMKQSVLLSYWTTLPPMARPAPWQQALSPREKQPYPWTPPYFSLSRPPLLFPNYKACCIYHRVNTKRYRDKHTHNLEFFKA